MAAPCSKRLKSSKRDPPAPPSIGAMESPLQQLLRDVEGKCDPSEFADLREDVNAAAEAVKREAYGVTGLFADVLAILLQPNVQGCMPDEEHVASCKQRGAAAFGRGQHRQAARLYSEALRYCDENCRAGASLAARLYANRALCLSKLQPPRLEEALGDASAAIACDPSFPKGWYRRAGIARALGRSGSSAVALADARHALQLLQEQAGDTAEAAALVEELEAAAAATAPSARAAAAEGGCSAASSSASAGNGHAAPAEVAAAGAPPAQDLAGLISAAGQQLAVEQTANAGRCLVAGEALPAGSDVLSERPFAHAPTKLGRRSACATCLAPLAAVSAPFYCRRCPMPAYCSAACREGDTFHRPGGPECCRPWTVLLPAEAVAALRLARRLQAAASESGSRAAAAASQVAQLGAHLAELDPTELVQLAALAAVAHATWQRAAADAAAAAAAGSGDPQQQGQQQGQQGEMAAGSGGDISAGDVLAALCRLQVNGLAVVPPERQGSADRLALALYPVGSLMNHGCLPNVSARFQGGQLVVRTLEALPAGQPLLHCYGPQAGEMTAAQRQRMLQQQYHFCCHCRACAAAEHAAEGGQLADAAPAGLKCPAAAAAATAAASVAGASSEGGARCEGAVLPACSVPAGVLHRYQLPAGSGACCACGAVLSQERWREGALPELQAAAAAHAEAAAQLEQLQGQVADSKEANTAVLQAIRGLRDCLRQRQALLHPHNLLLGATHDALAHAWHLAGNDEAAAQHLQHSLAVLRHAYPPGSTAAAFQQRQLAQTLRLAAAAAAEGRGAAAGRPGGVEQLLAEAREAEEAADAVLELHFGPDAPGAVAAAGVGAA